MGPMAPTPFDDALYRRLSDTLRQRVFLGEDVLALAAGDEWGMAKVLPAAVIKPQTLEQVVEICKEAAILGVGLVPRGAGTGKAGGCVPRPADWVVDLSGMNRLLELRPKDQFAVVEAGLINADLDRAA